MRQNNLIAIPTSPHKMLNTVKETAATVLQTGISAVEKIDPSAAERQQVFGQGSPDRALAASEETKQDAVVAKPENKPFEVIVGDCIDLFLHEGKKGLAYVQATQAYKVTDQYVNYVDTFEQVKTRSLAVGESVVSKLNELNERVVLFYDESAQFAGFLVKVLQ